MRVLNASIRLVLLALAIGLLAASYAALRASAQETQPAQPRGASELPEVDRTIADAERVAELEKLLSNAALVGHFTVTGEDKQNEGDGADSKLTKERYELGEVKHLGSNQWLIQSRIKYGDHDVTVPLTLPIRWADGETPVICVDDLAIPGLGTFTARVMIYRDHYAGYWTGQDHGGHLFGVIERGESK
jgi:hypothetical protein